MSFHKKDWLTTAGVLAAIAATIFTGGAAAPALAGAAGAAEGGAAAAGAAGAAEGAAAAAGAGGLAGGAAGAFGSLAGQALPASALATDALSGAATPYVTGSLTAATAPAEATGALSAAPVINPSDMAFPGSHLYPPSEVGQTTPLSFPGGKMPDGIPMNPSSVKSPMDYMKMIQMGKQAMGHPQAAPMQLSAPKPRGQQAPTESNEDIYKKYMMMTDPQMYQLMYGGRPPGMGGF